MSADRKEPPHIPKEALKFPTTAVHKEHPRTFTWVLFALVFVLAAILIALLVWLFVLRQTPEVAVITPTRPTAEENNEPESTTAEAAVTTQQALSPSTDVAAIETDLEGTTIPDLDPLFADIEAMF